MPGEPTLIDILVPQLEAELGLVGVGDQDEKEAFLKFKLRAARAHIQRLLGYRLDDRFGGADQEPVPDEIRTAILQLAAWWHEQREAGIVGKSAGKPPHSLPEIIDEFREWSF